MREYEVTIIIQPQLEEDERNKLIERISELLVPGAKEEEKPSVDEWGMRRLAYPIRKQTEGYYILYVGPMDAAQLPEAERSMQYIEDILRYMIVRKES